MKNKFDIRDNILYKYTGEDEIIYIPESVLIIKEKAFRFCKAKIIHIPNGVSSIEWGAFSFCENLEEVTIPQSVRHISISAFEECQKLKSIVLNENKYFYVKGNAIHSVNDETYVIKTEI